jgi:hypothetical protein
LEAVKQKQAYEEEFMKWVIKDKAREEEYGELLNEFRIVYNNSFNYKMEYLYLSEAVFASDIMKQAKNILTLIDMSRNDTISDEKVNKKANEILSSLNRYYNNDYSSHKEVDKKVFVQTMNIFYNDFAKERYMFLREKIEGEYKGSSTKYFENLFDKSFLSNPKQANKLLSKYKKSKIDKLIDDMAIEFLSPTWDNT